MSWYAYNNMECRECGYEYKQETGTLSVYDKGHKECPKCGGEVFVDKEKNEKAILKFQNSLKSKIVGCGLCNFDCKNCFTPKKEIFEGKLEYVDKYEDGYHTCYSMLDGENLAYLLENFDNKKVKITIEEIN